MISIVTSVHNQLPMNRLFVEALKKNTKGRYELIVVDNASTDGSAEFFERAGARVIRNKGNYSYPHCQNQGLELASFPYVAFFNNDIIPSPGWDHKMMQVMARHQLRILSFCGNDHLEPGPIRLRVARKWKRVKNPLRFLFGTHEWNLRLMLWLMYGDYDAFCEQRWSRLGTQVIEGFSGSCIVAEKSLMVEMDGWDPQIHAGDFDLYLRIKERQLGPGDIKPMQVALGIYFHHYQRLTVKSSWPPFMDKENLMTLNEKWGDRAQELLRDIP